MQSVPGGAGARGTFQRAKSSSDLRPRGGGPAAGAGAGVSAGHGDGGNSRLRLANAKLQRMTQARNAHLQHRGPGARRTHLKRALTSAALN